MRFIFLLTAVLIISNTSYSQNWLTTGNAGTITTSNFLGTTDNKPLVIRVNNIERLRLIPSGKVGIGVTAPLQLLHVNGNINIDSSYGLYFNNTRIVDIRGNNNFFAGKLAGNAITSGSGNVAIGLNALNLNKTGSHNVAIGNNALSKYTQSFNTAVGDSALASTTIGGENNIAYNTAVGYKSLSTNKIGIRNTALGALSLSLNSTGGRNLAIGSEALYSNTTASFNTAVGVGSMRDNTIGYGNTALGYLSLTSNDTGVYNTAIGIHSLLSNKFGSFNTATGYEALNSNVTGSNNTAIGSGSLYNNNDGSSNVALGDNAMYWFTSGIANVAVGSLAMHGPVSGSENTAVGFLATPNTNLENTITIGSLSTAYASNNARIGNPFTVSIGGQVGWTTFSDGRFKKNVEDEKIGLDFINRLRPVHYTIDFEELNEHNFSKSNLTDSRIIEIKNLHKKKVSTYSKKSFSGFIAQEVEKAVNDLNYTSFSGVDKPTTEDGLYGLRYAEFVVPLVKAVQELSLQNEEIRQENSELKARLDKLEVLLTQQSTENLELSNKAMLEQNIPNPAKGITTIRYSIPSYSNSAYINVYSSANALIRSIKIASKGSGSIEVKLSELSSGVYQYALIVDRKMIDRKQMIITK